MSTEAKLCHCGQPLHYSDPVTRKLVEQIIAEKGEFIRVTVDGRSWRVSRHYIALHGLKGGELPNLGFDEIPSALAVGTLVEKINSVPGDDAHTDAARAKIVHVMGQVPLNATDPHVVPGTWGYFVEWEDIPGVPVFISGARIRAVT